MILWGHRSIEYINKYSFVIISEKRRHEKSFFDITIFRGKIFEILFLTLVIVHTYNKKAQNILWSIFWNRSCSILYCCTLSFMFGLWNVQPKGIKMEWWRQWNNLKYGRQRKKYPEGPCDYWCSYLIGRNYSATVLNLYLDWDVIIN